MLIMEQNVAAESGYKLTSKKENILFKKKGINKSYLLTKNRKHDREQFQ